jgi:hypothetical protein
MSNTMSNRHAMLRIHASDKAKLAKVARRRGWKLVKAAKVAAGMLERSESVIVRGAGKVKADEALTPTITG